MTKQKKLAEAEEYETPLQVLLSYLKVPHKIYRAIYISIIERRLSAQPLVQNGTSISYLAQRVGIEPDLMAEKIKNLVRLKWLELEEIGRRDVNQIFVLSPVWRYKEGIDEIKFAVALLEYRASIKIDMTQQMSTKEVYALMNSVCKHTKQAIDGTLCELSRWEECKTCLHSVY